MAAILAGVNDMMHHKPEPYKGIEEYLNELCLIYRGETDNPHDVDAMTEEERAVQFLRFHLWDVERSILESPGSWRYMYIEEKGSLPVDNERIAHKLYDFAVGKKLERVKEFGIDLTDIYKRIRE